MSERLAFLRAIRANPDDDTARLVFADWLDERDDPLGAFIRVQLELEPIRYRIDNPRAMELHKCEDELLRAHGDEWIPTNELLTHPSDFGPVFRRGLPDYACLSLDTFLKNGEAILDAYPTLREVALYGVANRCWELTMCPLLANLETLEIADWPTEDDAISLGVSPHLPHISRFKLWVSEEMHFLRELVKQANSRWPRDIELVQLCGGGTSGVPAAVGWRQHHREQADLAAEFANATIGRPIAHVTRPFEQLFPIAGDTGRGLVAGHLPDGRAALAGARFGTWLLVIFTQEGHAEEVTARDRPVQGWHNPHDYGTAIAELGEATERWHEELQLTPGIIWVREFRAEDLSVELWPRLYRQRILNPSPEPPPHVGDEEWQVISSELRPWLERRNFVINWNNDYWADWRGKIHSS